MRVLVTGASGFIGRRLVPALVDSGHVVVAMTRRPDSYSGPATPVGADVDDPDTLPPALAGCDAAYYLVHSLDRSDFARRDARAATAFGTASARAGVARIVYLGGLGDPDDDLSAHLRSRQEVEGLLAAGGVPVTTLRAGVVIGDRGTSWELIRGLVEHLPALLVPSFTSTLTQPIALDDAVAYLTGVLDVDDEASHTYEIGGAEVLRYVDLLSRLSAIEGRPSILVPVPVPDLAIGLAALVAGQALPLLTGVDGRTIRSLVESLRNEVIVRDDAVRSVVDLEPMGYDEAVLAALAQRAARRREERASRA